MFRPRPRGKKECDVVLRWKHLSPTDRRFRGRWIVLALRDTERSVPVVQPDLNAFVRECLFYNDVRHAVVIHVANRQREKRIRRVECQFLVVPGGDVKFNSKSPPSVALIADQENCAIGSLILIEVSRNKSLTERIMKQAGAGAGSKFRHCATQSVLRPDGGRHENDHGKHKSRNG